MGEETSLEKLFKSMDKDGDGTVTKEVKVIMIIMIILIIIISFSSPMIITSNNFSGVSEDLQEFDPRPGDGH